jgi:ABC-2 type transport system ATP-binding protein
MTENPVIISIKSLKKVYKGSDEPAVDNISLDILRGEVFGLLGPNGAGKTTTISMLCGLFPPTDGTIHVNDFDIRHDLEKIKNIIGVVPQDIALYPTLTALENLTFFGNMYGMKGEGLKSRIYDCLKVFRLEMVAKKRISTYSGGMKRRINLIAGLLHQPQVLFLDEPTVGIDVQSRVVILEYLKEINKMGTTIIYTSHYMEEAENLCTRVAIVDRGKIIALGHPVQLLSERPEFRNLENIFLHLTGKEMRD